MVILKNYTYAFFYFIVIKTRIYFVSIDWYREKVKCRFVFQHNTCTVVKNDNITRLLLLKHTIEMSKK